jgi:peptide/nickel transport system permease protein
VPNDVNAGNARPGKTARQRINWAKLFWMLRQSPLTIVGGVIMIAMLF